MQIFTDFFNSMSTEDKLTAIGLICVSAYAFFDRAASMAETTNIRFTTPNGYCFESNQS